MTMEDFNEYIDDSVLLERQVIGLALHEGTAREGVAHVESEWFTDPRHSHVWTLIQEHINEHVEFDALSLWKDLEKTPEKHRWGINQVYLGDCLTHAPNYSMAGHYADMLKESYQRRTTSNAVTRASQLLDGGADLDTVKAELEAAFRQVETSSKGRRRLIITRASQIKPRAVEWLWEDTYPQGALSLLAGKEGLGKSTLAANIAARATRGTLPGDRAGKPCSVIYAATEDSWEYTIVPRLTAAGADLDRVIRVNVETATGFTTGLELPSDIEDLKAAIEAENVGLLVLDPLMSRLGDLDTHKDAEVRQALEPLALMASQTGVAIVALIHLNKSSDDPLNAVMGSKAFTAVARSVTTVTPDPDDETDTRRLFGVVKSNLARIKPGSQAFEIEEILLEAEGFEGDQAIKTGRLRWLGHQETTIKRAMKEPTGVQTKGQACADWLGTYLADNPGTPRTEVEAAAENQGYSKSMFERTASKLGVISERLGYPAIALWSLPANSSYLTQSPHPYGESSLNEEVEESTYSQRFLTVPVSSVSSDSSDSSTVEADEVTDEVTGKSPTRNSPRQSPGQVGKEAHE